MTDYKARRDDYIATLEKAQRGEFSGHHFNMDHWVRTDEYTLSIMYEEGFCNTSGCALGTVALFSDFAHAEGLKVMRSNNVITFDGEYGSYAGAKYLGIDYTISADELFGNHKNNLKIEDVISNAKRIFAEYDEE